uniref:acetate/propionate family kinase n=1 Tax=Pararhizobium sp. IMCC3301 TaxID=3067904 RepID=UPI0027407914|nr:acetate/propionate family kinase [Pararhizobium sp. IMCC3301]
MVSNGTLLVLNSGSSSVKFALFDLASHEPRRVWSGAFQRIGFDNGRFTASDVGGTILVEETLPVPDHVAALDRLLDWIGRQAMQDELVAVGHRIVHGGEDCDCSLLVTPELEARLEHLIPLAPLHMPHNLAGITAVRMRRPDLVQVAAFDTAFRHSLPRIARMTGLPRSLLDNGIRRYGFHGLSYEYVVEDMRRRSGHIAAAERIIVAHLGNGASMAAIRDGRSVETSMGFSTLAGLPMGTRPGDLDPGILLHLMLERQVSAEELQDILYHQSGLLGLSGLSRNMADLLARPDLPEAAEAIDFYCHHARRHLAGLTAALGGLDRLVLTGGIGANSPEIRGRICDGMDYLGLALDADRNNAQQRVVSADDSPVLIEAFKTDEELVIARHAQNLLGAASIAGKVQNYG